MSNQQSVIAVFAQHNQAEAAIRRLADAKFNITQLSIVGKGYHTEEQVVGFYNIGDRVRLWGANGAFWGALWGLFAGGIFMTIPIVGPVMVLGHLGAMVFGALEGAAIGGGFGALGAALASIGVPKNNIVQYEQALKADGFLVIVHASAEEVERAKEILADAKPERLDVHAVAAPIPAPAVASGPAHATHAEM